MTGMASGFALDKNNVFYLKIHTVPFTEHFEILRMFWAKTSNTIQKNTSISKFRTITDFLKTDLAETWTAGFDTKNSFGIIWHEYLQWTKCSSRLCIQLWNTFHWYRIFSSVWPAKKTKESTPPLHYINKYWSSWSIMSEEQEEAVSNLLQR